MRRLEEASSASSASGTISDPRTPVEGYVTPSRPKCSKTSKQVSELTNISTAEMLYSYPLADASDPSIAGQGGTRFVAPSSGRHSGRPPSQQMPTLIMDGEAPVKKRRFFPWFSLMAIVSCTIVFVFEIKENGWAFQPMACEAMCDFGSCKADGSPCEANPLLGPTMAVLDKMGAKNDIAIFDEGEWWRIISCNFLHAGVIHLVLNMLAVLNLGVQLERRFGFWRIGILYLLSGLFGTMLSVIFLPYVLSVGASAAVFGLVGACWADVIINYCARCTLEDSGLFSLLLLTILNLLIGLTPFVDNFMHVGGFVSGIIIGCTLFSKKHIDHRSGRRRLTCMQREIVFISFLVLLILIAVSVAAALSDNVKDAFRSCSFCEHINCVEIDWFTNEPWWSCCIAKVPGTCSLTENSTVITASCNMTGLDPFTATCSRSDADCAFSSSDAGSINDLCGRLCHQC